MIAIDEHVLDYVTALVAMISSPHYDPHKFRQELQKTSAPTGFPEDIFPHAAAVSMKTYQQDRNLDHLRNALDAAADGVSRLSRRAQTEIELIADAQQFSYMIRATEIVDRFMALPETQQKRDALMDLHAMNEQIVTNLNLLRRLSIAHERMNDAFTSLRDRVSGRITGAAIESSLAYHLGLIDGDIGDS